MKTNWDGPILSAMIVVGLLVGYAITLLSPHELSDEGFHAPLIWEFYRGDYLAYSRNKVVTTPPTYHLILGTIMRAFGFYSVHILRLINTCGAAFSIMAFCKIVRRYYPHEAAMRSAQFFFMPIIFPFFFLIYTDIWALLALLWMIYFCLMERHLVAGMWGFVAMLLRQTLIIWILFCFLLVVFKIWERRQASQPDNRDAKQVAPYVALGALFLAFVWWNRGVALGDRSNHAIALNVTNLYFFLLLAGILLLPYNLAQAKKIISLMKVPLVPLLLCLGFLIYVSTFKVTHPYNSPQMNAFLRNQLLALLTSNRWALYTSYIPVALMVLSLVGTRLPEKRFYAIYLFIAVSIVFLPLIEQRYYIPGLALLVALREQSSRGSELCMLASYQILSIAISYGIAQQAFFL